MNRRVRIIAMVALASFLLCGATAPEGCAPQPQPSHTGEEVAVVGIPVAIAVGVIVLVAVHSDHHTLRGCVSMGPKGLQVRTDGDAKTYNLIGVTANTRVGDVVKLHGSKEKKDSNGDRAFVVEKMTKDFGPCKVQPVTP